MTEFQVSSGQGTTLIVGGRVAAVVANENVYVLAPSSSRYTLYAPGGIRRSFCCQDGCCDRGLRSDVTHLVEAAKDYGAKRVVLRTGQNSNYVGKVAGLPVEDVECHIGDIGGGALVSSRR